MSNVVQLLLPCCVTDSDIKVTGKNNNRFSSAAAHAATACAVAIIIGVGSALAVYFLHNGMIKWSAIAGAGAASLSGVAIYTMLRCVCGKLPERKNRFHLINPQGVVDVASKVSSTSSKDSPIERSTDFDSPADLKRSGAEGNEQTIEGSLEKSSNSQDFKVPESGSHDGDSDSKETMSLSESQASRASLEESICEPATFIFVDRDDNLSRSQKIELLQEKLKMHDIYFRSDEAYSHMRCILPSQERPFSHYVIPIFVDDCIFEVELNNLGTTQQRSGTKWELIFEFKYLGKTFSAYGDATFHLEEIWHGPFYFAPGCFPVHKQQWDQKFKEWNRNGWGQQRYLTYFDCVRFAQAPMRNGTLTLPSYKETLSFNASDSHRFEYYIPDYMGYTIEAGGKALLITRSRASSLVDVECMDHISDKLFQKMHATQCRIPLEQPLSCYDIQYLPAKKRLLVILKSQSAPKPITIETLSDIIIVD